MRQYVLEIGDKEYKAELKEFTKDRARINVNGTDYDVTLKEFGRKEGIMPEIQVAKPVSAPPALPVSLPRSQAAPPANTSNDTSQGVRAPLPGLILDVKVQVGDKVKAGQEVVLLEVMKMENMVQAPHDGTVHKVYVQKDDSVEEDQLLLTINRSPVSTI